MGRFWLGPWKIELNVIEQKNKYPPKLIDKSVKEYITKKIMPSETTK